VRYEWGEAKARHNLAKHGLSFEDAPLVFDGPTVTFDDNRFDYGEQRFIHAGRARRSRCRRRPYRAWGRRDAHHPDEKGEPP
jgi:uncharacterized DUF497 family protein